MLTPNDLAFYNYDLDFKAEPGTFQIFIGGNSEAKLSAKFELSFKLVLLPTKPNAMMSMMMAQNWHRMILPSQLAERHKLVVSIINIQEIIRSGDAHFKIFSLLEPQWEITD